MAREDIALTMFTAKYPYRKGFFRGTRESSDWTLPPVCACCGAETQEALPERTVRGDLVIVDTMKIPTEEEIAAASREDHSGGSEG